MPPEAMRHSDWRRRNRKVAGSIYTENYNFTGELGSISIVLFNPIIVEHCLHVCWSRAEEMNQKHFVPRGWMFFWDGSSGDGALTERWALTLGNPRVGRWRIFWMIIIQRVYLNILRVVLCILLSFDINVHWCSQHSEKMPMSTLYLLKAPSFPKIGMILMPVSE